MCWRDGLSHSERTAMFDRDMKVIRRGWTLVSRDAARGENVHTNTHIDTRVGGGKTRRFFRKDYFSRLSGPVDTTEILLKPGTIVIVTKMPEEIRSRFGLRARDPREDESNLMKHRVSGPRAKIVEESGEIGLSFGKTGRKLYFPLRDEKAFTAFRVVSLPRSS